MSSEVDPAEVQLIFQETRVGYSVDLALLTVLVYETSMCYTSSYLHFQAAADCVFSHIFQQRGRGSLCSRDSVCSLPYSSFLGPLFLGKSITIVIFIFTYLRLIIDLQSKPTLAISWLYFSVSIHRCKFECFK